MKEILIYIGLAALAALVLYLIVKSIIESIKREQFRKKNRETQFSGSAVKEEKGFWASLFTPNIVVVQKPLAIMVRRGFPHSWRIWTAMITGFTMTF